MPGTLVQDAAGPTLLSATLTATATGTGVDVGRPGVVKARLTTGTVTGTTPTLDVAIQASDSSTFASGVVTLGKFAQVTASSADRVLMVDVQHRYVRTVSTVAGTTPSFGTSVVTLEMPKFRRTKGETA